MALQIRRGSNSDRTANSFIPVSGELVYTLDTKELYVGDGTTVGGTRVAPVRSVNGLTGTVALTTDDITAGTTNKYYVASQAKLDVSTALIAGNATNTGITFSFNSNTGVISAVVANSSAIANVQADANPALGGNLSLNSRDINGTGNINITGNIIATTHQGAIKTDSITPLTSIVLYGGTSNPLTVRGLQAASGSVNIDINTFKGSVLSPTNTSGGDQIGSFRAFGYYNSAYKIGSQITTMWASDADFTTNNPKSMLLFATGNNNASQSGSPPASLDGNGTFTAKIIQAPSYATGAYPAGGTITLLTGVVITGTAGQFSCSTTTLSLGGTVTITGTLGGGGTISGYTGTATTYYIIATNGTTTFTLSTTGNGSGVTTTAGTPTGLTYSMLLPQKGMMIFDSTTNKFMGYNGTNWVAFTGP
jgi:hypothetical protein